MKEDSSTPEIHTDTLDFSIVICAHDRKEYLPVSMESAYSQNYPKDRYEVILVKNFSDDTIDRVSSEKGVISVLTNEKPLVKKMVEGLKASRGRYVCFLEDDDAFQDDKLSRISEVIGKHGSFTFYRNSYEAMNERGELLQREISRSVSEMKVFKGQKNIVEGIPIMLKNRADWYGSMMCVRRESILQFINCLDESEGSADKTTFYLAAAGGGPVILDSMKTTRYRFHRSHTTVVTDINEFYRRKREFFKKSLQSAMTLESTLKDNFLEPAVSSHLLHETILSSFVSDSDQTDVIRIFGKVIRSTLRFRYWSIPLWYSFLVLKRFMKGPARKLYYILNTSSSVKKMA